MDKLNRNSRTSTVRETRKKQWMPPSSLDAPPAPKGFKHRWIRTETMGQDDTGNVSKKLREGWEFVRAEEIKSQIKGNKLTHSIFLVVSLHLGTDD